MPVSNRVLHAILDQMLQLLPDEPADSKRLDDIVDADASSPNAWQDTGIAVSAFQQDALLEKAHAAS